MYDDLSESNKTTIMPEFESSGTSSLSAEMILCNEYKLLERIGQGGMGQIWRAEDISCKREVALKFVPPEIQFSTDEMARVERMFELMHALHHEHICPMYTMKDGGPGIGTFLVMQYVTGMSLNRYFEETKPATGGLPLASVCEILHPIASALDYAHTRRPPVIHRDVKPSNILVVPGENSSVEDVQLIDFGLAETFRASLSRISMVEQEIIGTREYMAPEQWLGQYQDAATDQYALAVTAYELLAGHLPFESSDFAILRDCALNQCPPEISELPPVVNAALQKALSKKREDRFASCIDFINALDSEKKLESSNHQKKIKSNFLKVFAILLVAIIVVAIVKFRTPNSARPESPVEIPVEQAISQSEPEEDFLQKLAVQFVQDKWLGETTEEIMVCAAPQKLNVNTIAFISIINNKIEDEVLTWFSALPNLKKITFSGCENITEAGWLNLKSMDQLETLVFYNCKNFTDKDLAELQQALPKCEIQVK